MRVTPTLLLIGISCLAAFAEARASAELFAIDGLPGKPHTGFPLIASLDDPFDIVSSACDSTIFSASCEPFHWSPGAASAPLGLVPADTHGSAWDSSGDGQVLVGFSQNTPTSHRGRTAVRWVDGAAPETLATHSESVETWAKHITPDASVIAGTWIDVFDEFAFAWTESTGLIQLVDASMPQLDLSYLTGLSNDGQVAAYLRQHSSGSSAARAIRWTEAGGVEILGPLPGGYVSSDTEDIAEETGAITGNLWTGNQFGSVSRAYIWTAATGMQVLPLPTGYLESDAQRISSDGTTVTGQFMNPGASPLEREAFRWTAATGIQSMGPAPGYEETAIWQVSNDGAKITGYLHKDSLELVYQGQNVADVYEQRLERRAYLWREGVGRADLPSFEVSPTCDHDPWQIIESTSPDASIVFGRARCDEQDSYFEYFDPDLGEWQVDTVQGSTLEARFAWDETNGYQSLEDFVETGYGVDLSGWTLDNVYMTDDGATLRGTGTLSNQRKGWILYADPTPLPLLGGPVLQLALLATGLSGLHLGCDASTRDSIASFSSRSSSRTA